MQLFKKLNNHLQHKMDSGNTNSNHVFLIHVLKEQLNLRKGPIRYLL